MRVVSLTHIDQIHAFLETDHAWAAYALADLGLPYSQHAEWFGADDDGALCSIVLRYSGLPHGPLIFTMGRPTGIEAILDEAVSFAPFLELSIRAEHLAAFQARYQFDGPFGYLQPMWRMSLDAADFRPSPGAVVRLKTPDANSIQQIYAAGGGGDAFAPSQLATGTCFGARVGNRLLAVAGTHVVSDEYSVAAVGNVGTHPDHRGKGYATVATSAVCAALLDRGIRTIVLNVAQNNLAAIRVYEKLGFKKYVPFYEGQVNYKPEAIASIP
jgi:ribosomal protein S18 acetylase RimI-like enzyme